MMSLTINLCAAAIVWATAPAHATGPDAAGVRPARVVALGGQSVGGPAIKQAADAERVRKQNTINTLKRLLAELRKRPPPPPPSSKPPVPGG